MKKLTLIFILFIMVLFSCNQSTEKTPKKEKGVWELVTVKDEFGDATKETSILATFEGTMDNVVTSGSKLLVSLQVLNDSTIAMKFYEYGNTPAVVWDSYTTNREIRIKLSTSEIIPIEVNPYQSYIFDASEKHSLFKLLITEKQPFKIVFKATFNPSSTYTFEVNPDNFTEIIMK